MTIMGRKELNDMTDLTQSYFCGASQTQIIYQTIGNYFDEIVARYPEGEALVVRHQDIRWSWTQMQQQVDRLATGLLSLGIEPGDRVGIWGPNSYEWVLVQFATAKIGAIMVCINPAYRLYELEYALNKVECKAIVTAESLKPVCTCRCCRNCSGQKNCPICRP